MYLPLAQKMIEKQIKSGGVDSEAEMKLYVSVLERQEKYEDALFVLRGVLGGSYKNSHEKEVQDLEFVWKLGRWAELNKVAEIQMTGTFGLLTLSQQLRWPRWTLRFKAKKKLQMVKNKVA
eukprot:m.185839 g.185839  ORF g.185839 m.185839 type:complete len:121 (+) comp39337_c0_seq79:392-754(+)